MRKTTTAVSLSAAVLLSAGAGDFYMKSGMTDFSDANSYTNAQGATPASAPSSSDTIYLSGAETYSLQQGTGSFDTFIGAKAVSASAGNVVTIDVAEGEAAMSAAFYGPSRYPAPLLVKKGAGTLSLVASGVKMSGKVEQSYLCSLDVDAGDLAFMTNTAAATTRQVSSLKVLAGARLLISEGTTSALGLTGGGSVTNATSSGASLEVLCRYIDPRNTVDFSGTIDGVVNFSANGPGRLRNTSSSTSGSFTFPHTYYANSYNSIQTEMGVDKFGMAGERSSIGTADKFYTGRDGAHIRYCGTGETTDKSVYLNMNYSLTSPGVREARIDGGVSGGLVFAGTAIASAYNNSGFWHSLLELSGSNTTACAIECPVNHSQHQGKYYPIHIKKLGTGTWALRGNAAKSENSGALTVEEGVLQFDTLAPAGVACSLGTAQNLYKYETIKSDWLDDSMRIPYAITLGKAGSGNARLEFTSTGYGTGYGRLIGLAGDACIASAGEISVDGISAIGAGSHRTLTLESAAGSVGNEASNITNGEGVVSVVKTGVGSWTLSGETSFTGPLVVSNGTLNIRKPGARPYTWFRFTFKGNWNDAKPMPNFHEIALYTTNGVRRNKGLVYERTPEPPILDETYYSTPAELPFALARNHVTYQNSGTNRWHKNSPKRDLGSAFDDVKGQPWILSSHNNGTAGPVEGDPSRWLPIVMRLDESAGPITAYDFVCGNADYVAKLWTVEGSLDGGDWHTLTNAVFGDGSAPAIAAGKWYSEPEVDFTADRILPEGKGFPLPGWCPADQTTPLSGVSSVFVAPGATLSTEGGVTLNRLGADPSAAEPCTVRGFSFASDGVLTLPCELPGSTADLLITFEDVEDLENVANWSVSCDGRIKGGYSVSVVNGKLRVQKSGLTVILR